MFVADTRTFTKENATRKVLNEGLEVATAYDVIVMPNTRVMFSSAATSRGFTRKPLFKLT